MPKVRGTRKQRAAELLDRIRRGPSFSNHTITFTVDEAATQYKRWSESWIVHELIELVPELKGGGK